MAIVIPYVKQTWADGSGGATPISAARLGVLEEGILDVSQAPAVRVFHSANQSLTSATLTALAFDSERFDQAGGAASTQHDTVTNNSRLTCRYAGVYQISGTISFAFNATGVRLARIRVNGTTTVASIQVQAVTSGSNTTDIMISTLYSLAVNDYVELLGFQDSGGALNVAVSGNYSSEFMMVRAA